MPSLPKTEARCRRASNVVEISPLGTNPEPTIRRDYVRRTKRFDVGILSFW